jgi:hypothetical protein
MRRGGRAGRSPPATRDACAAARVGISATASRISEGERALADVAPINWTNAVTLISVAILVGTELVGAGAAAGWAIGGAHSDRSDRTLLFSARGGRARADPRLAGRALAAKIAFRDRRRGPRGCIRGGANRPAIAQFWNANCGTQSAKRAPGRFGRNADRPG